MQLIPHSDVRAAHLYGIGDGQARVGWGNVAVHEDDEEGYSGDERNTDKIQTHGQPTHSTAEQIVTRLVCVKQGLIPGGTEQIFSQNPHFVILFITYFESYIHTYKVCGQILMFLKEVAPFHKM